jgi:hypothetical protein
MFSSFRLISAFSAAIVLGAPLVADEGMYPISELGRLDLKSKGLQVSVSDLYNPAGISLIDAIVQVGGCTGSFVSAHGLILTNHHCAFGGVQAASSKDRDYVTDGFLARTREEEIPARGYAVRITESYRDVSAAVLAGLGEVADPAERARTIEARVKAIVAETESANPGKRAEVAEMFAGRTYVLFVYTNLRDVRLVYVPPRAIGEFGGEIDNWVWPRHTGDFSFMRAYVAPDGRPADYAAGNVPYSPRRFLKVNPGGANEGDAVFILGYPGRTYRHRTSHYLDYEARLRMPFVAELYAWQIQTMEELGKTSREVAIKHDARIKGLANVMKNYRGKLQGVQRLDLVSGWREGEAKLQAFIDADPERRARFGTVLQDIGRVYDEMAAAAPQELILDALRPASTRLNLAYLLYEGAIERQKPDLERQGAYMDRNRAQQLDSMKRALRDFHAPTDRALLGHLLLKAAALPAGLRIPAVDAVLGGGAPEAAVDRFLDAALASSQIGDEAALAGALERTPSELEQLNDPWIALARDLLPTYQALRQTRLRRDGTLSRLQALLVDVKQQMQQTSYLPDANGTLRFTFGRVRGYSPADAVQYRPVTTLKGVVEKTTGAEPFNTPATLMDLFKARDFGRFAHPALGDVPVAILYDLDTTGGNSGSPLMNARGELVGVNFDRAFEATINDYAWSESYSRSIAVDIRYVLWVTSRFARADHILEEAGVSP